jgi:DNA-binding CsgD family transcriptional regulator
VASGGVAALERALATLGVTPENVLDQLRVTLAVLDEEGRFLWQNALSIERVGDRRGCSFLEVIAPEHRSISEAEFLRLRFAAEPLGRREVLVVGEDGVRKRSMVMSAPIRRGTRVVGVISVGIPITWVEERGEVPRLSRRQHEALELLAAGCSTRQIAAELGVTVETARNYIRRLLSALDVHSRVEAVARARELGLITGLPGGGGVR